jgi:hypothetical protein
MDDAVAILADAPDAGRIRGGRKDPAVGYARNPYVGGIAMAVLGAPGMGAVAGRDDRLAADILRDMGKNGFQLLGEATCPNADALHGVEGRIVVLETGAAAFLAVGGKGGQRKAEGQKAGERDTKQAAHENLLKTAPPSWLALSSKEHFIPKSDVNKEQFASNLKSSAAFINLR